MEVQGSVAVPTRAYTLAYTGERYLPWSDDFITAYEHIHRYLYATRYTVGKRVLDIACGEGYGTHMLARNARSVLGVDADAATLDHARVHHGGENIRYVRADAQQFHLAPNSMDVVVSFETLEHFPAQEAFVAAMKACLAPGGLLLLSTPNRPVYSGDAPPYNPFHAHEFDRTELLALLKPHFAYVGLCGQHMVASSLIARTAGEVFPRRGSSFVPLPTVVDPDQLDYPVAAPPEIAPRYFLVVCSDTPLPPMPATFLLDNRQMLWEHLHALEPRMATRVQKAEARLSGMQETLHAANQRAAETAAQAHRAETRAWEAETELADVRPKLWQAETQKWEAETELADLRPKLWQAETELADVRPKLWQAETQKWEAETELADLRPKLWQAETRAWEAETELADVRPKLWQAETRAWEAETELADLRPKLWQAETQKWEAETQLYEARTRLHETHAQLRSARAQLTQVNNAQQRLRAQRATLMRVLLHHSPVGPPPHALVLIPGGMNYFYDQTGRRLAESLTSLGLTVDVCSLGELPETHARYDWVFVVNIAEVLLAYAVTDPAARRAGRITLDEQERALVRLARVRAGSQAIGAVQLDAAGTYWFDHACNLCVAAGIPTFFDLGFHDQSETLLPYQRPLYHFLFNGLTESERVRLDSLPEEDTRPVPWIFVGHHTPDRTDLVRRLIGELNPRGFVYMPILAPFTDGGPHLDEAQFATVLSRAQYQIWRSHHAHFYLESERFRQSALAGGVPVKLMTAPLPPGPLPFRDFLLDAESFAAELRSWDFAVMRRRVVDEFRALPPLDDSLLAALTARSPVRHYGT